MEERLQKQLHFFLKADQMKNIFRQNYLADGSRKENDAEHSWHLALMCLLFFEHGLEQEKMDLLRVLKMAVVHDLVEIEAGDTYCYDEKENVGKAEREKQAEERLFSLLPADQEQEFRDLWEEFEERSTPEARFAAALDRLQPLTLNYRARGKSWQEHDVSSQQVWQRNSRIAEGSPVLWDLARSMIEDAVQRDFLREEKSAADEE